MLKLTIDVSKCAHTLDVYGVLLAQLGAPEWHGKNLDALWDTVSNDGINAVRAPYTIRFVGVANSNQNVTKLIGQMKQLFEEAKSEGLDVGCLIE
jgi:RNAse (barnase) inhibitor barstar